MKKSNKLKAVTLILVIVLITIVSFLGVYNIGALQKGNLVKDYTVGMELKGKNVVRFKVDDTVKKVATDEETNKTEGEATETEKKGEPVNAPELLTKENYKKSIKVMQDRLSSMDAGEYKIRYNEENGIVELELADDMATDYIITALSMNGEFAIIDADTKEVLISHSAVEDASVLYSTSQTTGATVVYLDIEFNKVAAEKLEEISKTYVATTEKVTKEDGTTEDKTVEKKVSIKIGDSTIVSTSFGEPLTDGHLSISVGQASNSGEQLQGYALQASSYAAVIANDPLPLVYTMEQDYYTLSNISADSITNVALIALAIEVIILIVLFRIKGIVSAVLQIGYVALLLLVLKYANVYVTIEGIVAIVFIGLLNTLFMCKVLSSNEVISKATNDSLIKFINISIPVLIASIAFSFASWTELVSFGMITFWGCLISLLYNLVFTKCIFKNIFEK